MKKILLLSLISFSFLNAIDINPKFKSLLIEDNIKEPSTNTITYIKEKPIVKKERKIIKQYVENNKMFLMSIEKLIEKRKLKSASDLFNSLDIDMKNSKKREYKIFFKIGNSFLTKNIVFNQISFVGRAKTKELLNIFFEYFDKSLIQDTNYNLKMISLVDQSNLSSDDKSRYKSQFYYLSGKATIALQLIQQVVHKTKEDKVFEQNLFKMLTTIQEIYFKQILKTTHKQWALESLKRSNQGGK